MPYALFADLVLLVHFAFVLWVVLGLLLILLARPFGWRWAGNRWLRLAHLASIGVVVAQAWGGVLCPLTEWENRLRVAAGQDPYAPAGFIAHWVRPLLFFDLPAAAFTWSYTAFGLLVLAAFAVTPVRWRGRPGSRA